MCLARITAAAVLLAACTAQEHPFASPQPTADQVVNQFQKNGGVFHGYRRNHAKGVCISGHFTSSGELAHYSVAQVFARGEHTPMIGRLSIPGTNPYAWDGSTPIRGMALQFTQANGKQWRTAINGVPAFPVATPAADYAFMQAQQPDPATGDPDPKRLAAFFATHPRANAFRIWDHDTPPSSSFATVTYNSLDAFELVDANGNRRAVRWSMVPVATPSDHSPKPNKANFLAADLRRRLARGPLHWHLVFTFASPGDAVDNASIAWPATGHRHVDAGTLTVDASTPQAHGPCRDINFNPLVLPTGIEPSNDPLLKFRAQAYTESHRRRVREHGAHRGLEPASAATSR